MRRASIACRDAPPLRSGADLPRDAAGAREQAILVTILRLAAEVGLERVTMNAVAARAHASKATIPHRWSGPTAVVAETLQPQAERNVSTTWAPGRCAAVTSLP